MENISENGYIGISKYDILNNKIQLGSFIRANPINPSKNTLYGFLIKIDIKNNLYSKTTMMLKFIQNGKPIFIKIYPIKYDMFYKVLEDKKRKMFESLLQKLDN
jgi:hypothetical protein